MRIETIRDRLAKASEKITKKSSTIERKTKTIERKREKIASGKITEQEADWLLYEIRSLEDDISRLKEDVESTKATVAEYQRLLEEEEAKAKSRTCKPILDFLERWKSSVTRYYHYLADAWEEEGYALQKREDAEMAILNQHWTGKAHRELADKYYDLWDKLDRKYACIRTYKPDYRHDFDDARLQKDLSYEATLRYDQLINRVMEVCGEIVDASYLSIGEKGDLEGYITGKKGIAEVWTIGAGGYNIQCFHYRTLVKPR